MAKLTRATQKVFAGSATNNGVFGSLQAGSGQYSNDVATIQSLPAYTQGWNSATISSEKLPPLEEFQGLQYASSYQLAYIFQEGIPEWDSATTYYQGSVVKVYSSSGTFLYSSITNDNIGNNPTTSTSNWVQFGSLPDQTGNSGKFLTTDGSQASWGDAATTDLSNITAEAKDLIAGLGMPSEKYIDLDLKASQEIYIAQANGWFVLDKLKGNGSYAYGGNFKQDEQAARAGDSSKVVYTQSVYATEIDAALSLDIPAMKGDIVTIHYDITGTTRTFKFVYAEGSKE